ncbi:hypothetical protein BGZ79_010156, partial [Entomortierella chlamydospora]
PSKKPNLPSKSLRSSQKTQHINMPLFKRSSKNQSSSAASTPVQTPSQTPRVSMQEDQRPLNPTGKATRDQVLSVLMSQTMGNGFSRTYVC